MAGRRRFAPTKRSVVPLVLTPVRGYDAGMLHGRGRERAVIGRLLAAARAGEGGVLVVRGEPGIGKSALLADAAQRAVSMRVLRAVGVEAESALAYATLRELLHPVLGGVSAATRTAGARPAGRVWDPGRESARPVPGVAGRPHAAVRQRRGVPAVPGRRRAPGGPAVAGGARLRGRRLAAEPVALLLAVRDGTGGEVGTAGLAELPLTRLAPDAAAALLDEHHGAHLDPVVRRQLLAVSGGNPLALVGLPAALTGEQRAGRDPLDDPLPLAGELERGFLRRVRGRDPQTQTLLLLAAAEGAGRLAIVRRAAERLSLDPDLLESAALADLVRVEQTTLNCASPDALGGLRRRRARTPGGAPGARRGPGRQGAGAARLAPSPRRRRTRRDRRRRPGTLGRPDAAALRPPPRRPCSNSRGVEPPPTRTARAGWPPPPARLARRGATARTSVLLDRAERLDPRDPGVRLDLQYLRARSRCARHPRRRRPPPEGRRRRRGGLDRARAMPLLVAAADAAFLAGEWAALAGLGRIAARLEHDLDGDLRLSPH